jgi:single-strand DNA-binding protein
MSEGLNRVILLGNLGTDPELKIAASGQAVLKLRIATNESYLDKNKQRVERVEWHDIVVFGVRAEALAKLLSKGSRVLVEGGLRTSSYESSGVTRYKTEVIAREICFAGKRSEEQADDESAPRFVPRSGRNGSPKVESEPLPMEDIPF